MRRSDWGNGVAERVCFFRNEWEVEDFLDGGRHERSSDGALRGHRNGYEPKKVRTAEGSIMLKAPQVRNAPMGQHASIITALWEIS